MENLNPKHQAYAILRNTGINQATASKMLGFTNANGCLIDKKLNKQFDLTSNKSVKLASQAHKKILDIFVHPDKQTNDSIIDIKGSDVTKAIDRVYDRVQPVKRSEDHVSMSFIQINLDSYTGQNVKDNVDK